MRSTPASKKSYAVSLIYREEPLGFTSSDAIRRKWQQLSPLHWTALPPGDATAYRCKSATRAIL